MKTTKDGAVIFDKEDLIEKLGLTEEQSEKIIKYQKTLPILSGDKGTKVNARDLWIQLGEPQGHFADWINRKVIKKGFDWRLTVRKILELKLKYNNRFPCGFQTSLLAETAIFCTKN